MPTSINKEDVISYKYTNVQGKVFAIDCQGKYGIIGGQKTLFLANLENSSDLLSLRNDTKKIQCGCWSTNDSDIFVTAASEVVELWDKAQEYGFRVKSTFHGHTRPICNLDWSPLCFNLVTSCSFDGFTYVLDIRDFKKPSTTLQSTLPPSLAKWNKVNEMVLATSHEGGIEIWDLRNAKPTRPLCLITAHSRQINDFDWSPNVDNQMITCSMDNTLKIWNTHRPKEDRDSIITLNRIVLGIRYTSFGNAVVTQCMSQGTYDDLFLLKLKDKSTLQHSLIHSFESSGGLSSWDFRRVGKDLEIVGWNNERMLKFWKINSNLRKLCDSSDSEIMTMKGETSCHPETLSQEFELLADSMPHIEIEKKSASERLLIVSARVKKEHVCLEMRFPAAYPDLVSPEFIIIDGKTLDVQSQSKLVQELIDTANKRVKNNQCCVESCLRVLISFLGNIKQESDHNSEVQEFSKEKLSGENVPFPRTSGARFCGPGFLVCFTRRMWMEVDDYSSPGLDDDEPTRRKNVSETFEVTPRAMSALAEIEAKPRRSTNVVNLAKNFPTNAHIPSISLFFERKDQEPRIKKSRSKSTKSSPKKTLGPVIVYDLSCLSPIQKQLGESYVFDDNPSDMCQKNAQVALSCARKDLYQVWSLLAHQVAETTSKDGSDQIYLTPFGKNLIKIWYDHYSKMNDVQTLAMICCVLSYHKQQIRKKSESHLKQELIFTQIYPSVKGQRKHSNSCSENFYDASRYTSPLQQNHSNDVSVLESMMDNRSNSFIKVYSNILFQWGFVNKRAELLNFLSFTGDGKSIGVVGARRNEICSLCHLPVRGHYVFCFECCHGGHVTHLSDWFSRHDVCPSGCGCRCIIDVAVSI